VVSSSLQHQHDRIDVNGASPSRVCDALQSICWTGQIKGFSNREPIVSLSLYASREWFTDVQQSHMQ
jgi:hypothetical protein